MSHTVGRLGPRLALVCGRRMVNPALSVMPVSYNHESTVLNRREVTGRHDFRLNEFGRQCRKIRHSLDTRKIKPILCKKLRVILRLHPHLIINKLALFRANNTPWKTYARIAEKLGCCFGRNTTMLSVSDIFQQNLVVWCIFSCLLLRKILMQQDCLLI